jgi:hypothetical protein
VPGRVRVASVRFADGDDVGRRRSGMTTRSSRSGRVARQPRVVGPADRPAGADAHAR